MANDKARSDDHAYVVLVEADFEGIENGVFYEFVGTIEKPSATKAKQHFAEANEREGNYVAVPARSFLPEPVKLERTPRAIVGKKEK